MKKTGVLLCLILFVGPFAALRAELRLPAIFSDHMALQCGRATPCWGWAGPREEVTVLFRDAKTPFTAKARATADATGRWRMMLPALPAGSNGTLLVEAGGQKRTIGDVVAGEVWLGSGQSNMTYRVGAPDFPGHVLETARAEAAETAAGIRIFTVIQEGADAPADDVKGKWVVVGPDSVANCSAIAWNFAFALRRELRTPVGVIVSGYGGTPVESWLPRETLDSTSSAGAVWKRHADLLAQYPEAMKTYERDLAAWERQNPTAELKARNQGARPREPYSATGRGAPVRLFDGMIHGLAPYAVQGVIWYQGEENSGRPAEYPSLIQAMVLSWRKLWGVEWPFYYVELANARAPQTKPSEGGWALIREAQAAVLALPKTGVATAVDVSDGKIHPWNKKPVGERLAGLALHDVHGRPGDPRSPEYASREIEGDRVRLHFRHADGLRARAEGKIAGFAIRGAGGDWQWAEAAIQGDTIEAWSPAVPAPVAVRYGWASNPVLSVENRAGLPLRPFRTDPESP